MLPVCVLDAIQYQRPSGPGATSCVPVCGKPGWNLAAAGCQCTCWRVKQASMRSLRPTQLAAKHSTYQFNPGFDTMNFNAGQVGRHMLYFCGEQPTERRHHRGCARPDPIDAVPGASLCLHNDTNRVNASAANDFGRRRYTCDNPVPRDERIPGFGWMRILLVQKEDDGDPLMECLTSR